MLVANGNDIDAILALTCLSSNSPLLMATYAMCAIFFAGCSTYGMPPVPVPCPHSACPLYSLPASSHPSLTRYHHMRSLHMLTTLRLAPHALIPSRFLTRANIALPRLSAYPYRVRATSNGADAPYLTRGTFACVRFDNAAWHAARCLLMGLSRGHVSRAPVGGYRSLRRVFAPLRHHPHLYRSPPFDVPRRMLQLVVPGEHTFDAPPATHGALPAGNTFYLRLCWRTIERLASKHSAQSGDCCYYPSCDIHVSFLVGSMVTVSSPTLLRI